MISKRRKVNVNIKFVGDKVVCAKSPIECRNCSNKNMCENMDLYYYVFEGIQDSMKARSYRRHNGAIVEKYRML